MKIAILLITSLFFLPLSGITASFEKDVRKISEKALNNHFFTAVSISVWKEGKNIFSLNKGIVNSQTPQQKVTSQTLFDLASLTKPIVTTSLFTYFEKKSLLNKDWKISRFFPAIKKDITLYNLLTHTTTLPAYDIFYKIAVAGTQKRKEAVVNRVANYKKEYAQKYSDINYILLGFIIEKIGGAPLDILFKKFLTDTVPFKNSFSFKPLKKGVSAKQVAATYPSLIRKRMCQGEVEDENCAYLGGITGHAGLFGTAEDVAHFFSILVKKTHYKEKIHNHIGFDQKSSVDSNYGSIADYSCSGHLGWSGTAFLICPHQNIVITILTNRTHSTRFKPTNLENIKLFRQQIFNAILKSYQ